MTLVHDPRIDDARNRTMREVLDKLPPLAGVKFGKREAGGPCPKCGGDDRFSINFRKGVYNCRFCGGGDHIGLVQFVLDCTFMEAIEVLEGERVAEIDPAERERRRIAREKQRKSDEAAEAQYRAWSIQDAVDIWCAGGSYEFRGSIAEDYLAFRVPGFELLPHAFKCFRFIPDLPYVKRIKRRNHTLHSGPVLVAAVQAPDGMMRAVHRTWIDLDQPSGKAQIFAPDGKQLPSKVVRGSKQGGAIRLTGNACGSSLVSGEGIETTLTALVGGVLPGASYWAGVDLGNMSGKRIGGKFSDEPDMDGGPSFVPPCTVNDFWLIKDGDSEPRQTQAQLTACAKRAMRINPGLSAYIVPSVPGGDLNDMIKRPGEQ
ncbi:DUF7146 domain-containing protein [Cribrihabitans pelagius]|uniref:DUF7146 domain-containing protein n=1 Tax=Cribrihabitans pelagius TaxID=1765746 RepID=UPI003B59B50F